MKIDKKTVLVTIGLVLAFSAGLYFRFDGKESGVKDRPVIQQKAKSGNALQKIKKQRRQGVVKAKSRRQVEPLNAPKPKPQLTRFDDLEEKLLNEFSRQVLMELQQALDSEDFKTVARLVAKMLERPPDEEFGAAGVNRILRRRAVEALGWFGAKGLPELVGMLADSDPEIVDQAFDQFTLALEDISLSDYERADIVVMAAKVLTNSEHLEMLLMEVNNMRHSVGAGALTEICLEGTENAKKLMPESIEFFTGEDNIETVEDMDKWLQENPDGPDDDDLYGGDSES